MDEKKKLRKKIIILIALFVVFIASESMTKTGLQITKADFWLTFAMGGLFFGFIKNIILYFKMKG
jgi:hypothetical protein